MLRGQYALYSGNPEEAVKHLENSVKTAEERSEPCLAAESTLSIAYLHAGQLGDEVLQSSKVDSLEMARSSR